jgi:CHAT domain-containing protein/tetratricopeptide (TPR) repeat protein
MSGPPDRSVSLARLAELQTATFSKLSGILDVDGRVQPDRMEEYLSSGRRYLHEAVLYEKTWPGSFQLDVIANPLVQQLSIYADYLAAGGDRSAAALLREEADGLAAEYLGGEAAASLKRTRAMEAAMAGQFHHALIGLDEAQAAFVAARNGVEAAKTLVQLSNVYEWLNDNLRALDTLEAANALVADDLAQGPPTEESVAASIRKQVRSISIGGHGREGEEALGLRQIYFEVLQARARINRKLGNYDLAREQFELARPFVESYVRPGVDFHLAAIALAIGDYPKGEALLRRMEPDFNEGLLRPRRAALNLLEADLCMASGRFGEALRVVEEGIADQDLYPDLDLLWKLQWRRARALAMSGRSDDALNAYRQAASAADTLRMAPLGYALDTMFVRDKLPMLEEAIEQAAEGGDGTSVVWFAELIKSRALSAILSNPRDDEDLEEDADARQFDQVSHRIDAISFMTYSGAATADQIRERSQLVVERRNLLERIRLRDPRWRSMSQPQEIDVRRICAQLAETSRCALVFHVRGPRVWSALLDMNGVVYGKRDLSQETLDSLIQYANNLHLMQPDWFLADISSELGVTLEDLLSDEVSTALTGPRTLLVVPHGVLHLLPWSTMTLRGHRLLETAAVGVLPNLAAINHMDRAFTDSPNIALFGDPSYEGLLQRYPPLPEAAAELQDLEALYGPSALLTPMLRGAQATEAALTNLLSVRDAGSAVLHVACHANADADEPLSSGLVLTASTLDAADLMQQRCGFPEVVLSACSTGWRPQSAHGLELIGDDALGLVASFLEAGARSLIVSITQAKDDVARRFSVSWHRHRRAGESPLAAYQRTQQELFAADPSNVWSWAGITAYSCT